MQTMGLEVREVYDAFDGWMDGVKVVHFVAYSPITGEPETFKFDGKGWMKKSPAGGWVRGENDLLAACNIVHEFNPDATDKWGFQVEYGCWDCIGGPDDGCCEFCPGVALREYEVKLHLLGVRFKPVSATKRTTPLAR